MDYVSRSTWGARHAAGAGKRPLPCTEAWLHHTTTKPPANDLAAERAAMRELERIGQQRFRQGFSYNLAIMPSGRVYVGCGVDRIGSHTGGRNTPALGIVLVGNYHDRPVPAPMRHALVEVLRDAKAKGWLKAARLNGGHRDLKATACPGDNAYALIPAVNKAAATPSLPGTLPQEVPRMIVKFEGTGTFFEVVGSHLEALTSQAYAARGKPKVTVLPADHPLSKLPKTDGKS